MLFSLFSLGPCVFIPNSPLKSPETCIWYSNAPLYDLGLDRSHKKETGLPLYIFSGVRAPYIDTDGESKRLRACLLLVCVSLFHAFTVVLSVPI